MASTQTVMISETCILVCTDLRAKQRRGQPVAFYSSLIIFSKIMPSSKSESRSTPARMLSRVSSAYKAEDSSSSETSGGPTTGMEVEISGLMVVVI